MPSPKTQEPAVHPRPRAVVHVPRLWLIALTALLIVPWLVVAGVAWVNRPARSEPAQPVEPPTAAVPAGPWGTLTKTPIVISPPMELASDDWGRDPHPPFQWLFPGTTPDVLAAFLASTGLTPEQASQLQASARPEPRVGGLIVTATPELLRSLSPEVRAKLYLQLGKTPLNFDESNAFRYAAKSPGEWFDGAPISPATRKLVEPLLYRNGEHLYFADVDLIRSEITDRAELRNLAKTLLRQPTYIVKLQVRQASEVAPLADYWGLGGRRTDIRPLLESVAGFGQDQSIDIIHLLPPLVRQQLYRYPRLTAADLDRPALVHCLWTAMNFFNATPDDRFLDLQYSLDHLKQDYYIVENNYQLGDIIVFLDDQGNIFHAAVVIADDLVFTKNGQSPMAPWVIVPLETLKDYYRARWENPRLLYHRRKDL